MAILVIEQVFITCTRPCKARAPTWYLWWRQPRCASTAADFWRRVAQFSNLQVRYTGACAMGASASTTQSTRNLHGLVTKITRSLWESLPFMNLHGASYRRARYQDELPSLHPLPRYTITAFRAAEIRATSIEHSLANCLFRALVTLSSLQAADISFSSRPQGCMG